MEAFTAVIAMVIATLTFLFAEDTEERYPNMKVQPVWYLIGGFFLGILPMIYLFIRRKHYGKTHNM